MENPNQAQHDEDAPHEGEPITRPSLSRTRLWLWRLFLVAVWFVVYWILPSPMDTWSVILTVLAFGIWVYNRASGRLRLIPLTLKFEKIETIRLTHILLVLLLLVMFANHFELLKLNTNVIELQDRMIDVQNNATNNTEEIKSSLDDVKNAIDEIPSQ